MYMAILGKCENFKQIPDKCLKQIYVVLCNISLRRYGIRPIFWTVKADFFPFSFSLFDQKSFANLTSEITWK